MKINLLLTLVMLFALFAGCTVLEKIAPSAIDEQENVIAGTHELTPAAETATRMVGPYGQAAAGTILLVWNFIERFRRNKSQKGFVATVRALKQAGEDDATKAAFEQIKVYLQKAHQIANVESDVKSILAKL